MVGPLVLFTLMQHKRKTLRGKKTKTAENSQGPSKAKHDTNSKINNGNYKVEMLEENQICRVCLKEGDHPIYGNEDLSDNLNTVTGIGISFDDDYPKYLCQSCNALLQGAILLRRTAHESDKVLKQQELQTDSEILPMIDSDIDEDLLHSAEHSTFDYEEQKVKLENENKNDSYYHCKKCELTFETLTEYREHRLSPEHDNLRKTCPICNNDYNSSYLKRHMALHKNETPYMCDICGKNFVIHGQFTRHRVTHFLEDLPFKCSLCPYKGRFTESLKMHMRTHTGEKPYQCPHCPTRSFVNKSNLNKHMLTHKKVHNFTCSQCQKGFYSKRDLDLHFKVDHSGIKDHICNVCGKAFGYRKQMMKHQLKVHKRDKLRSGRTPLYILLESKKQLEAEQT